MPVSKKPNLTESSAPEFFSPQVSEARRFYLNLKPSKKVPLSVVSGGLEYCLPDYRIQRATFPFYSLEYVVRGSGSLRLNKRDHILQAGTVFSYGPGVAQTFSADPKDPLVKYFVDFSGALSKGILRSCQLPA